MLLKTFRNSLIAGAALFSFVQAQQLEQTGYTISR